jgi:hypothetical protein
MRPGARLLLGAAETLTEGHPGLRRAPLENLASFIYEG